ncbi:hydroxyisourate hydrolase [Cupriavidus basilensis]
MKDHRIDSNALAEHVDQPRRQFAIGSALFGSGMLLAASGLAATPQAPAGTPAPAQDAGPIVLHGVSPRLTIHTLDTYHGAPATGLRVDFSVLKDGKPTLLRSLTINANGRANEPLLIDDSYRAGSYELLLHVDDYFAMRQAKLPRPGFLSKVPIRFQVADTRERIHLPVQFGPWSYTYYRGS